MRRIRSHTVLAAFGLLALVVFAPTALQTARAAEDAAAPAATAETPAPAAADANQAKRRSFEDLKAIYDGTDLIIQFQVEAVQARTQVSQALPWEVEATLVGVLRGTLTPGKINVHVESIVRNFDLQRAELVGKQFVAAVRPMSDATPRRFQLVGGRAFLADSPEAEVFRQLADADATRGSGGNDLKLEVKPLTPVFPVDGAKQIEVLLTNLGKDSATYLQQPLGERDGKLYFTGEGRIRILDASGRALAPKDTLVAGQVPPGQPTPALILPQANFKEIVDLDKYFTLSAGRYTLVVYLAPPSGRGRIVSNGLTFQVGAVNLPDTSPPPAEPTPPTPAVPEGPAVATPTIPDPATYEPGQTVSGLAGLLRPAQTKYNVGDPVRVEFRLVNRSPRSMAIDTRLERTLTFQVRPLANSPELSTVRQVIIWPADGTERPEQRAYLREGSFWGQTLNLNAPKSSDDTPAATPKEVATEKDFPYERFGQTLFVFSKAGFYEVTATYKVPRPAPSEAGAAPPTDWWFGELTTNSIIIQIVDPSAQP